MKILVLGKGFVSDHLPYEKYTDRIFLDEIFIDQLLYQYKPDVVINCIGKTGRPNIDQCEFDKEKTYLTNTILPSMLASRCLRNDIHFIQIGSGCIYFGTSPNAEIQWDNKTMLDLGWKETDFANPKSFYSKTKYACDLILGDLPNTTILRIRMPISTKNNERNFINKIRGYKKIIDIPNSMTFIDDFVRCVDWVVKNQKIGIYHVTNPEPLSAAQVMKEYQKYIPDHQFEIISEKELDQLTLAKRSNCILNTDKLVNSGFVMTPSSQALEQCMSNYIKNI